MLQVRRDDSVGIMSEALQIGDTIDVETCLSCATDGNLNETGYYTMRADVIEIFRNTDDTYDILFTMQQEHPCLLAATNVLYSFEDATYELCGLQLGESFSLDIFHRCFAPLFRAGGLFATKKQAKRKREPRLTAYQEALLDPDIAGLVLTVAPGIKTRRRFYPVRR